MRDTHALGDALAQVVAGPVRRLLLDVARYSTWGRDKHAAFKSLEAALDAEGFAAFSGDIRTYGMNRKGEFKVDEVRTDQRGALAPFAGKRVIVVCVGGNRFYASNYRVKAVNPITPTPTFPPGAFDAKSNALREPYRQLLAGLLSEEEVVGSFDHDIDQKTPISGVMLHFLMHAVRAAGVGIRISPRGRHCWKVTKDGALVPWDPINNVEASLELLTRLQKRYPKCPDLTGDTDGLNPFRILQIGHLIDQDLFGPNAFINRLDVRLDLKPR